MSQLGSQSKARPQCLSPQASLVLNNRPTAKFEEIETLTSPAGVRRKPVTKEVITDAATEIVDGPLGIIVGSSSVHGEMRLDMNFCKCHVGYLLTDFAILNYGVVTRAAPEPRTLCKLPNHANESYSRVFGDGSRNFEPWSNGEDGTWAGTPSPNFHTPHQREDVLAPTNLTCISHHSTRWVFSSTRLELMIRRLQVCYLDHLYTVTTCAVQKAVKCVENQKKNPVSLDVRREGASLGVVLVT
ncbi:hypothetical protein TNCV_4124401 [Trichonephila clavipes]|nr:hypothetical protein TNCV_4124401 [Trichonephila clavipes]